MIKVNSELVTELQRELRETNPDGIMTEENVRAIIYRFNKWMKPRNKRVKEILLSYI